MTARRGDTVRDLVVVVGARPNFVKAAPLVSAFARHPNLRTRIVHTGQHYDEAMSRSFLRDLSLPRPDAHLRVGSGTHGLQTGRVMERLEAYLDARHVDRLVVVGDVNSTMGAALTGAKLGIPVDHVEAGLRSGDRSMPEEINRIVTDSVASRFFVSEPSGVRNLLQEGHPRSRIHHVGNVMIDSLVRALPRARARAIWTSLGLSVREYGVVTLHRPANVDDPQRLESIRRALVRVAGRCPLVFPVHPRTAHRLGRLAKGGAVRWTVPLGYLDFLSLLSGSRLVITDSGGIQEETTYLGIPCLTLRSNTERPITVEQGTNTLVGADMTLLERLIEEVLSGAYRRGRRPRLWDGRAAERIARILAGPDLAEDASSPARDPARGRRS